MVSQVEEHRSSSADQQGSPGRRTWLQFAPPEQKELMLNVFVLAYIAWVK